MNGIIHLLDQAGVGLMQLTQENQQLRERVAELEAQLEKRAE